MKKFKVLSLIISILIVSSFVCGSFFGGQIYAKADADSAESLEIEGENVQKTSATNCVALVLPKDSADFSAKDYVEKLDKMYNTSSVSMKTYLDELSLGKYEVNSVFVSGTGYIELDHDVDYYKPRYSSYDSRTQSYAEINPEGYDNRYYYNGNVVSPNFQGAKEHVERVYREQALIRELAEKLQSLLKNVSADKDGNGIIDAMTFVIDLEYSSDSTWDSILWPHMSYAYALSYDVLRSSYYLPDGYYQTYISKLSDEVYINGLRLSNYNLLTTGYIDYEELTGEFEGLGNVGVLCHEYLHNLGLYDYYSYTDSSYQSVGELDILGLTDSIPQFALSYIRQKLGWLDEGENILAIEKSGHYELEAVTSDSSVKAYKLVLNDFADTGEYFMLEMRSNAGYGFDSKLSSSGLVVYRVNEKNAYLNSSGDYGNVAYGNMYGGEGRDEVYVFREGAGKIISNGKSSLAMLNGRRVVDGWTYDTTIFGSTDTSLQGTVYSYRPSGIMGAIGKYYNTTIHYSDGSNSGVAIKNITLSSDQLSVSFDIEFDDESGSVTDDDSCSLSRTLGGDVNVEWTTAARSGSVTVLAVEYDDSLISSSNGLAAASRLPSEQEMISGQMSGYKTVISKKTPISFKQSTLKNLSGNVAVFVMFSDGENCVIKFAGATESQKSFSELLWTSQFKAIVFVAIGVCALLIIVISVRMFIKSKNDPDD